MYQLSGGIQRYLEAFPDGGFFHGKNFVFDDRIAVGSAREETVGACSVCHDAVCDDYRCMPASSCLPPSYPVEYTVRRTMHVALMHHGDSSVLWMT